jgi:hypothetical protein
LRLTLTFAALWVLILTSCAPAHNRTPKPKAAPKGSTGYVDPADGIDYLHNGDPVAARWQELREHREQPGAPVEPSQLPPAPPPPQAAPVQPGQPAQPVPLPAPTLQDRVREFEISRFGKGEDDATRFGSDRFQMKVFFRKEKTVTFEGKFCKDSDKACLGGGKFTLTGKSGQYTLSGELTDSPERTVGLLHFTDTKAGQSAEISYRAFRAKLTMRRDTDQALAPGSSLEKQLRNWCDNNVQAVNHCTNSFGWVNNWVVMDGPAFYLIDIVHLYGPNDPVPDKKSGPRISFKGESKRTYKQVGGDDGVYEAVDIPAESLTPDTVKDVKMWGNSEKGGRRGFEVSLQDKDTKESNDVYLDVEAENPEDGPEITKEEMPQVYGQEGDLDSGGDDDDIGPAEGEETPENGGTAGGNSAGGGTSAGGGQTQRPAKPAPKPQPQQPGSTAPAPRPETVTASYLATDTSSARAAKMIRDFNQNKSVPGVLKRITAYQRSGEMKPFFVYTYPLRRLLKSIASAYDVTPAFGYICFVESEYCKGGHYTASTGDRGLAVGPFQIHPDTAVDMHLPAGHRPYFAPSACGAASYISGFVQKFPGDNTVAILAYNQGGGTAANVVARYKRMAGKYSYTYSDMSRMGAVLEKQKAYVEKYLAAYFIGSNLRYYGFDPSIPGAVTRMPRNKDGGSSVIPSGGISDSTCRSAVSAAGAMSM